jgi:DNA-binding PadR family transcriptional regulator
MKHQRKNEGIQMPSLISDLGRFSGPGLLILSSLAEGPKHGYAIMTDVQEFSGTKLEPGTLYGALTRLEQRGWIEPLPPEERRRPYRLTGAGATVLRQQLTSMDQIVRTGQQRLATTGA